ncbi:hypothetical protein J2T04_003736 [Chryseobacterium lathyri]|uniref:NERD domain-containing protein n=1 Tax=Chryseobacterium lathyri TaxID=395933 RepID=A0ABT9SSM6_9FLAO|nr:hypothetical protein [Chryseobacterium lathyri]
MENLQCKNMLLCDELLFVYIKKKIRNQFLSVNITREKL